MENAWERLPEWARWILFLPATFLAPVLVGLFFWFMEVNYRYEPGPFFDLFRSGACAFGLYVAAFYLAPRGKMLITRVLCGVGALGSVALLLLMATRGLHVAGILTLLPLPPGETWTRSDWKELFQSAVWVGVSLVSPRWLRDSA